MQSDGREACLREAEVAGCTVYVHVDAALGLVRLYPRLSAWLFMMHRWVIDRRAPSHVDVGSPVSIIR